MPVRSRDGSGELRAAPGIDLMRRELATLPETGYAGFEGLVAAACSELASVPFRLVGSGRQFGRDAEALSGRDAILIEAKRYTTRLSYADMIPKLVEALDRSGSRVEVWGAAATVPLDAAHAGDLKKFGEERGVTVLLLDWTPPLPPLAVMLASARSAALEWFGHHRPSSKVAVEAGLESVRAHPSFGEREAILRREFDVSTMGLAHARRRNAAWLRARFADRMLALQQFNQALAPLDPAVRPAPLARPVLEGSLRAAMTAWRPEPALVAVIGAERANGPGLDGDEGVGKTWAVASAWLGIPEDPERPRPMLLFMASHMWREGDEAAPTDLIARLLAEQAGGGPELDRDPGRWKARLERWLDLGTVPEDRPPALVIVLDGINERLDRPWSELVAALLVEMRGRPVRLVLTSRRAPYLREVRPRVTLARIEEVEVEVFSEDELDASLLDAGRDPRTVGGSLRSFLRNPRVLKVGLDLLDRLDPEEVGVERLLFEYLRKRQEERTRSTAHTAVQLARTLVLHAREIRERILSQARMPRAAEFDERTMSDRSGVPPRRAQVVRDLDDLIDSQFLQIADARRNTYAFTAQALPLGLGLLVVDELSEALAAGSSRPAEVLDALIDPIRAIDGTATLLLAALELALADPDGDPRIREELLHQMLVMQNVPAQWRPRAMAGVRERPETYVAVADRLWGESDCFGRREWVRAALIGNRFHPAVAPIVDAAIRRWLRSWQPEPVDVDLTLYGTDQAEAVRAQHDAHARGHRMRLAGLAGRERTYVDANLVDLAPGQSQHVGELAVTLLVGRGLREFAEDLFAWCVAAIAGWQGGGEAEAMNWLRRLAPSDWREVTDAVGVIAAGFSRDGTSAIFVEAIELALLASGDPEQAAAVAAPRPPAPAEGDPRDPDFAVPDDLDGLAGRYEALLTAGTASAAETLYRCASKPLATVRLALCRHRPEVAVAVHRELVRRLRYDRSKSPTVLAAFAARDSAILAPLVDDITAWYAELSRDADLPTKEANAATTLLVALLPHVPPERKLVLHDAQRDEAEDAFWLAPMLSPVPDALLREEIEVAEREADGRRLRLALVYAGSTAVCAEPVVESARRWSTEGETRVRAAALRWLAVAGVGHADEARAGVASGDAAAPVGASRREVFWRSARLARTAAGVDDPTLIDALHPDLHSAVIERGGERLAGAAVERVVKALNEGSQGFGPPEGLQIEIVRTDEVPDLDEFGGVTHSIGYPLLDGAIDATDGTGRRMLDCSDYERFERDVVGRGIGSLLYPLTSAAIDRIATVAPSAFERLITAFEEACPSPQATIVARDVARALSHSDPGRALALLRSFENVSPVFPEVMPTSLAPRSAWLLWSSADVEDVADMRRGRLVDATTDLEIFREVSAAESAGRHEEVVAFVMAGIAGEHPAALARALTVAGFARPDARLTDAFRDDRFRHGFLGRVAEGAKRAQDEAIWAERWFNAARGASDAEEVWRCVQLATASADARCLFWMRGRGCNLFEALRPLTEQALSDAARGRDRSRRDTLFHMRAPPERDR